MHRWGSKREMMGDDPPYLAVGTEVSAKYKGAFCEAKVRKIVRSVKCKIAYKLGSGTAVVTDDQIKGTLRAGSVVEVKHADKKELVEATIIKIQDCSQYTVVFDDGDITTLRRTALCLKSGRHFAESETLDQLPLTHPEHFGNPVVGGRRGRRNRHDDSSDDDESSKKGKQAKEEKEADIGKVVCVEISEKKKQKDNWFPGLVVAPRAQDTVKINVKEDYLVRSFKDGRYYTVPKKEATPFTREIGQKVDNHTLRAAVEKALLFLDRDELPPHWDRELLFGLNELSDSDSDAAFDSDSSDDEPREEKDHFVAQLYKFMDDRGTPINKGPTINGRDVDLYKLFKVVHKLGGCNRVTNHNQWKTVSHKLGFGQNPTSVNLVKQAYKKFLHSFEDFYRKLGCTMVNHPRGQRARQKSNRSLIRDRDKALLTKDKQGEKEMDDVKECPNTAESNKDKEILPKEEPKVKEVVVDALKFQRESRKDPVKCKSEKMERKEEVKCSASTRSSCDLPVITKVAKDDKLKGVDREERIKIRELAKHDNIKDEQKVDKDSICLKTATDLKNEDGQRLIKLTRREAKECKKEEKEEDKSKLNEREVRAKKMFTSNPLDSQASTEDPKAKKSRSLFSKMTGSKRIKPMPESKLSGVSKPTIGLHSVRQKRTFTERMKAMVKKIKLKTGVKSLRHKSPPSPEDEDGEEKKKGTTEDNLKQLVPQLTRSKSKEEVAFKARKTETNNDKKSTTAVPQVQNEKKSSTLKKRKEEDKTTTNDETLDQLPNYKTVAMGDRLKVYYGPTHESKVTYEAKVLNMKEEDHETLYLVHYTGWNTRYDEWIKRSRIADNLSWTPGRAKRTRQQQQAGKVLKRSKSGEVGPRSTTPSSVTSSSSRSKGNTASRAMRSRARSHRNTHTDVSESESGDDSESEDGDQRLSSDDKDHKELLLERMRSRTYRRRKESGCESDVTLENKRIKEESDEERTRSRSEKKKVDESLKVNEDTKKDSSEVYRSDRLRNKRKGFGLKTDSGDEKDIKKEAKDEENKSQKITNEDKRKLDSKIVSTKETDKVENVQGTDTKNKLKKKSDDLTTEDESKEIQSNERRRSRRMAPKKEDTKISPNKDNIEPPKEKDNDQNLACSEHKSITSIKKSLVNVSTPTAKEENNEGEDNDDDDVDVDDEDDENNEDDDNDKIENSDIEISDTSSSLKNTLDISPEDVYEFKEPEPFEFEVRPKCGDEKGGKLQRRSFGRIRDDSSSTSPVSVRRKLLRMKSNILTSLQNKRKVKKAIIKIEECELSKIIDAPTMVKKETEMEAKITRSFLPQQKKIDDESKTKEETAKKSSKEITEDVLHPLSLFSDLPGEVEEGVDEDNDDQMAISGAESESESQEPLFSHQQRDHEDFLPSCITQSSSVDNSLSKSPFSGFSEKSKESDSKDEEKLENKKTEDDEEDDPIRSAIQRVQKACSQSAGEDSNDIDLLTDIPDSVHKNEESSLTKEDSENSKESTDSHNIENLDENAQSNHSDESDDPVEIPNCKVIEEINLDTSDSEPMNADSDDQEAVAVTEETATQKEISDGVEEENNFNQSLKKNDNENEGSEAEEKESEQEDEEDEVNEEIIEISQDSEKENETNQAEKDNEESEEPVELDEDVVSERVEEERRDDDEVGSASEDGEVEEILEKSKAKESAGGVEKEDNCEVEEGESNLESLLCEETIPGSPTPASSAQVENRPSTSPELPFASAAGSLPKVSPPPTAPPSLPPPPAQLPPPAAAAPVMENTPPTTPESSLSPISNSPRGERSGSSPVPENDSSKSNRDSSEVDLDSFPAATKVGHYSEEDTISGVGNTNPPTKKAGPPSENETQGIKKRRRSHKRSEESTKRIKLSHRSPRHSNMGSESDDDTSENSLDLLSLNSRSPRPSKYNFFVQLDPELDASQRIAVLQQKLAELRKTYMTVKAELAGIDRRRKKLRRREREASVKASMKPEVPCS